MYMYIYRERERERVDVDLARVRPLLLQFGRRACHELLCIAIHLPSITGNHSPITVQLLSITIQLLSNYAHVVGLHIRS